LVRDALGEAHELVAVNAAVVLESLLRTDIDLSVNAVAT
jgi:hypothetical protein